MTVVSSTAIGKEWDFTSFVPLRWQKNLENKSYLLAGYNDNRQDWVDISDRGHTETADILAH